MDFIKKNLFYVITVILMILSGVGIYIWGINLSADFIGDKYTEIIEPEEAVEEPTVEESAVDVLEESVEDSGDVLAVQEVEVVVGRSVSNIDLIYYGIFIVGALLISAWRLYSIDSTLVKKYPFGEMVLRYAYNFVSTIVISLGIISILTRFFEFEIDVKFLMIPVILWLFVTIVESFRFYSLSQIREANSKIKWEELLSTANSETLPVRLFAYFAFMVIVLSIAAIYAGSLMWFGIVLLIGLVLSFSLNKLSNCGKFCVRRKVK